MAFSKSCSVWAQQNDGIPSTSVAASCLSNALNLSWVARIKFSSSCPWAYLPTRLIQAQPLPLCCIASAASCRLPQQGSGSWSNPLVFLTKSSCSQPHLQKGRSICLCLYLLAFACVFAICRVGTASVFAACTNFDKWICLPLCCFLKKEHEEIFA